VRDIEHSGQPKKFANFELQELLDENSAQTLLELLKALNVTSKCLHAMGTIHKEGIWLPHELSKNEDFESFVYCHFFASQAKKKEFFMAYRDWR